MPGCKPLSIAAWVRVPFAAVPFGDSSRRSSSTRPAFTKSSATARGRSLRRIAVAFGCLGSLALCTASHGQSPGDPGKREYERSCAICHGVAGKGDGPYRRLLTVDPSDLTLLARNNGGVLPVSRVYDTIDGRADVAAHGPREMPIWGYSFRLMPPAPEFGPFGQEALTHARILALIDYLNRLQVR